LALPSLVVWAIWRTEKHLAAVCLASTWKALSSCLFSFNWSSTPQTKSSWTDSPAQAALKRVAC
jgi:hypothetical protein